jgi:hypothetical protein
MPHGIDNANAGGLDEFSVIEFALTPTGYTDGPMTLWAMTNEGRVVTGSAATAAYLAGDTIDTDEFPSVEPVYGNIAALDSIGQPAANNPTATIGPPRPPLTPQQKKQAVCNTLDDVSKGAAVAGDVSGVVSAGAGVSMLLSGGTDSPVAAPVGSGRRW